MWIPDEPPTLFDFFAILPGPFPVLPLLASISGAAYLLGAIRLWRQGRRWPVWRTISFVLGCLALAATTGLGVEVYGYALLSVFMFQQLTLMMVIPTLLVLGSPGTLLLRATPHHGVGAAVLHAAHRGLRSRGSRWALSLWLALPLYLAAFYGLYLTGFADKILAAPGGHLALEFAFLAVGILFAVPVLSSDPLPVRLSHGGRALDVFAEAALHAFFGVLLMMSTSTLLTSFVASTQALGIDPLEDQQLAGGLAWSYGEAPTLLILVYVMHRWFREDTARAAAEDRYADVHGTVDLDAYNAHLETLHRKGA
ncbi:MULTISPECIES: cytochrome c oxidase assembly protein [unclassified Microbacterium]|uniref:cytochrome c oxidase assembly protein n=1 Tax=unclassified Microbacterium TaxID=2609290 RepID=UPI000EA9ABD9|nr:MULTISPECIES: cytochrome c oxidase assembly protein [unclassified Microbacterium]MBT2485037.1 cytochrome c oxidase assembly protein [Microbacterium sp. ISL-108]RKN67884.1 cytochrome c oxidase assembly protein [Microbacterium sp. CGR2]